MIIIPDMSVFAFNQEYSCVLFLLTYLYYFHNYVKTKTNSNPKFLLYLTPCSNQSPIACSSARPPEAEIIFYNNNILLVKQARHAVHVDMAM